MKRPSFQFYPADWKNNAKLRRCSEAARGAWMDILGHLHDSDEYGIARYPLAELARASGVALKLARELASKAVLKGSDGAHGPYIYTPRSGGKDGDPVTLVAAGSGPCWYSSRMVRDEWVRQRRGQSTQFTTENQPPKATPKPPIGERQGDGSSTSSPSTSTASEQTEPSPPVQSQEVSFSNGKPVGIGSVKKNARGYEQGTVTIEQSAERIRIFKQKLAAVLGPGAWSIIAAASDDEHPSYAEALETCKKAADKIDARWPWTWPDGVDRRPKAVAA
jgi:hypothetical protein